SGFAPARAEDAAFRLVMLGDSLTSGYGLDREEALPAQLEAALAASGVTAEVVNAGVAGDTTAGGRARFDWATGDDADAVLIALGGNDLLRGLDPAITEENLEAMIVRAQEQDLPVFLAGMRAPTNWGEAYRAAFDGLYPSLAEKHDLAFFPFLLNGVAGSPALNQPDGIHPNPEGVAIIVDGLAPAIADFIQALTE
ncbi:MAG: arylesterase, partial [Pseudomonadota bacterium]